MFCLRRYGHPSLTSSPLLSSPISYKSTKLTHLLLQLAPSPLHPYQRLPNLHRPLLHLHLLPQPTVRVLFNPAPHPLRLLLPLVRPLFLRLQQ
jgi:hypothetical protein